MLKSLARFVFALSTTFALCSQFPVAMNRYNQAGTSADSRESTLNASNVNPASFGKLYGYYVDGSVFAQPLYLPAVPIPGRGARNVLYVATMNDKVYAFDADRPGPPRGRPAQRRSRRHRIPAGSDGDPCTIPSASAYGSGSRSSRSPT